MNNAELNLTLAYIACGAQRAWKEHGSDEATDAWEGELNYIAAAITRAELVDAVAQEFANHPCVFAYEVAEEFGEKWGAHLIADHDDTDREASQVLRAVMLAAGYDSLAIDAALWRTEKMERRYYTLAVRRARKMVRWYFDRADEYAQALRLLSRDVLTFESVPNLPAEEMVSDYEEFFSWHSGYEA